MASVREIAPNRWELRVYTGKDPLTRKPRQKSKTVAATGKRDATRQANAWEVELHGSPTGGRHSFGELLDKWFTSKARRWSPGTVRQHNSMRHRYLAGFEDVDVRSIGTETLDDFYIALTERGGACQRQPRCETKPCDHGRPLDPATVVRLHKMIHSALNQAVAWGWVARNVSDHADPGEVDEDEVEPPEPAAIVKMLAEAERVDFRLAVFMLVAVDTGARRGANCALRRHRIDLVSGTVSFPNVIVIGDNGLVERRASRTKRTAKLVALNPYTLAALRGLITAMEDRAKAAGAVLPHDCFVFSDDVMGQTPWHPDTATRKVRLLLRSMGLDDANLHALRHAMATMLLNAGIAPQVVAKRGGWANVVTMLNRYAHSVEASDRAAADAIGALLGNTQR